MYIIPNTLASPGLWLRARRVVFDQEGNYEQFWNPRGD